MDAETAQPEPDVLGNVSLLTLGSVLIERRRTLVVVPLFLALATYAICTVWPKSYTVPAMLAPGAGTPAAASPLTGLAAQFGLGGTGGVGGNEYYAQVLTGFNLLADVVRHRYPNPARGGDGAATITLIDYYDEGGASPADSLTRAVGEFRKHVVVRSNNAAGIFTVEVDTHDPELSLAVSRRLLDALTTFNAVTRGSSARARREFLAARLAAAADSFESSQRQMQEFLERNRTWQSSPRLVSAKNRLDVALALRTQVYQNLASQYEVARIDEVNDTPVLTVVDPPTLPTIPSSPRRRVLTALALLVGGLLALAIVVVQEFDARLRAGGSMDYQRLRMLAANAAGGLFGGRSRANTSADV